MTHEINTSKGKFLFVGVPEGTKISKGYARELKPYVLKFKDNDIVLFQEYFNRTIGNGEVVSLLSTITEDQARGVVENIHQWHKDYMSTADGNDKPVFTFDNAIESLHSLMRAERLYTVNPIGSEPDEDDFERHELPIFFEPREEQKELNLRKDRIEREWQQAQSRTFPDWLIIKVK